MSLHNFLRMPTQSDRGELALVNPDERRPSGHFVLHNPIQRTAPTVKLYFAFDKTLRMDAYTNDLSRKRLIEEAIQFFNVIEAFNPFKTYVLLAIDLPFGEPFYPGKK